MTDRRLSGLRKWRLRPRNRALFCLSSGWLTNFDAPLCTVPNNYCTSGGTPTSAYYGDIPKVWWNQHYGYGWSPVGDWAVGSWKGECPLGLPVYGVSSSTDGTHSNALLCGQDNLTPPSNGSTCYARTVTSWNNNLGYTGDGDWDVGYTKDECAVNEYVQGVAQDLSGNFNTILCCPGTPAPRHLACNAYGVGFASADWDPGNMWANCFGPTSYVAGVSRSTSGGGVHHILCCLP